MHFIARIPKTHYNVKKKREGIFMGKTEGQAEEFRARLGKRLDELKWLYSELYHNDENAFQYFLSRR